MAYRQVWDGLVKEIHALCRIKDIDFMMAERWWERVLYRHSKSSGDTTKRTRRNNKEIYTLIVSRDSASTPNQQSLK